MPLRRQRRRTPSTRRRRRAAARHGQGRRRATGRAGVLVGRRRAGAGQLPGLLRDRHRPAEAQPFGVYWPALVANDEVDQVVVLADGTPDRASSPPPTGAAVDDPIEPADRRRRRTGRTVSGRAARRCTSAPARATRAATPTSASGPATTPATPGWPRTSPPTRSRRLSPRPPTRGAPLRAAEPAGAQLRARRLPRRGRRPAPSFDPQAKGLGEYLRSRSWPP